MKLIHEALKEELVEPLLLNSRRRLKPGELHIIYNCDCNGNFIVEGIAKLLEDHTGGYDNAPLWKVQFLDADNINFEDSTVLRSIY